MAAINANVAFYMNARSNIIYGSAKTIAAAILQGVVADYSDLANAVDSTYAALYGTGQMTPLDAIEHKIAGCVDGGEQLPISNPEGWAAAQWIAQAGLASLPNPVPRAFVIYLAKAFHDKGTYPTMDAALSDILTTKTFT